MKWYDYWTLIVTGLMTACTANGQGNIFQNDPSDFGSGPWSTPVPEMKVFLMSPQDGATFVAGSTINWTIEFEVTGDTDGATAIVVDYVQNPSNPVGTDLSAAPGVPSGMEGFARPAGITSPAGYGGTVLGLPSVRDVLDIGGVQNTLGVVIGPGIGEDIVVDLGVGIGRQVLASGSFVLPSSSGTYSYLVQNGRASLLLEGEARPMVVSVDTSEARIDITATGGSCSVADIAAPFGVLDLQDLVAFITAFQAQDPIADINNNMVFDLSDITLFVGAFNAGCV